MAFIRMKQRYVREGRTSTYYVNVLPERLTLDRSYVAKRFTGELRTLFHEVKILEPEKGVTKAMQVAFEARPEVSFYSETQLLDRILARLSEVIEETWDSSVPHVVLHSSGLDSRLLSALIMRAYRRGRIELGKVLFLCSRWEGDAFTKIMQHEGWDESQYRVAGEGIDDLHYYSWQLLDWRDTYKRLNGVAAIPVNLFYYPMEEAERLGLLPDSYHTFSGYWGNMMLDAASGLDAGAGVAAEYRRFYLSHLCSRPIKGSRVFLPYTDVELVRLVAQAKVRLGKQLRPKLVARLDPELAAIPEQFTDGDRHRRIADDTLKQVQKVYDGSWYGRKVHPGVQIPETTEFNSGWSHWSAACLCEVLLENDYKIAVK